VLSHAGSFALTLLLRKHPWADTGTRRPCHPSFTGLCAGSPLISPSRWGRTLRTLLPRIPWTRHRHLGKQRQPQHQNLYPLPHHVLSLLCEEAITPSFRLRACAVASHCIHLHAKIVNLRKNSPSTIFSSSVCPFASVANGAHPCGMSSLCDAERASILPNKVVSG
jgi:hypothetical protein